MCSPRLFIPLTVAVLRFAVTLTWAQEPSNSTETSCVGSSVISLPSRPTVSNATDTTQCGVIEVEYGLERQWPGNGANRDDLSGGLRMGLAPNLDFHWSSGAFLHVMDGDGDRTGFGDTWLGLKYRFLEQTKHRPSWGLFYQAKVPSAGVANGLGSGRVDHALSVLVSKDIRPVHLDFNVTPLLAGRPTASGFDHDVGFALRFCATNASLEPGGRRLWLHSLESEQSGIRLHHAGIYLPGTTETDSGHLLGRRHHLRSSTEASFRGHHLRDGERVFVDVVATLIPRLPGICPRTKSGVRFSSNPENGDRGWPGSPRAQTTPAKVHSSSADESL